MVLHYAKRCVTFPLASPNHQLSKPSPPLILVHGGAGTGKSRLISSIYTMLTETLKKAGDDPSCPYVVLSSFTGAASANINGQTLHSLFGFKFGTTFLSMPEKQRAEKRLLFRNLRCVIIDEISMVSADMLYNLDLRLREITMVDDVFGGLCMLLFGDLFQLQPVKARYVFKQPTNKEHGLAYTARNLWKLFTVVNLVENHRQGEDKVYGDLLNRVRTGAQTEEDIALLQTRVCPKSALSEGAVISSERETSNKSTLDPNADDFCPDEHPCTPSPHHYLPDDFCPDEHPRTPSPCLYPPDDFCPDEHPSTPSPRHYLPDDFYQVGNRISSERPPLQPPFPEEEHPSTPSPRHYLPDDFLPVGHRISSECPTLQQPSNPQPPHLPRKRAAQPLSRYAGPPSKKPKTKANNVTYIKMESPEEYKTNIKKRIEEVLRIASRGGKRITYKMYEKAVVDLPRKGSEVLLQRDIDECFINNYSSEWIVSWDANIDISPVYDYYGTITYITDYFTKVGINIQFSD